MTRIGTGPYVCGREDAITIKMELNEAACTRHAQSVAALIPDFKEQLKKGDLLKVNYKLWVAYFGDVVEKLEAVKAICSDPDVVRTANCEELEQGRLLVYEAFKRLDEVIQQMR